MRTALLLFLLAVAMHAAWALTIVWPVDWDPAYYTVVARHIARGDGAVVDVVWNLLRVPPSLPEPADLHWMPLPSRVLVPLTWAWPAHGAQATTVLLAACWAPLAWALARATGATSGASALAGLLAASAGGYVRFLSTPDSMAIYGVIGGLALLFAARPWARAAWVGAALLGVAAALTRGDGFLLSICLALAFPGWRALAVGLSGPLGALAWNLRNQALLGPEFQKLRAATIRVMDPAELLLGTPSDPTLGDRLAFLGAHLPGVLLVAGLAGVFLLPWPALAEGWRQRRVPVVRAAGAYAVLMPVLTLFLAPGVAASGTPFRSGAALFPLACALGAQGLFRLGRWGADHRGYPPAFLPAAVTVAFLGGSVGLGIANVRQAPRPGVDCASLPPGPLFASDPLQVAASCDRPTVLLHPGMSVDQATTLADHFGIRGAIFAQPDDPRASVAHPADAARLLPGWAPGADRVFAR